MILKLISKIVYQGDATNPEVKEETFFYDGFDSVCTTMINDKEPGCGYGYVVSCFTTENTLRHLKIMLFKKEELVRVLYVDLANTVYLMTNEGKTIERIN